MFSHDLGVKFLKEIRQETNIRDIDKQGCAEGYNYVNECMNHRLTKLGFDDKEGAMRSTELGDLLQGLFSSERE